MATSPGSIPTRLPKLLARTPSLLAVIGALFLGAFSPEISYGKSAKDFFREGERLLKSKDPYGAHKAFAEAAKLDAKNKKYQRALAEAARLASDGYVSEATGQLSTNPKAAFERLKSALEYNSENKRASETLAALEAEIGEARRRIETERRSLDLNRVESAAQLFKDTAKFRELIPEFALLEADLSIAQRLLKAEASLNTGDLLAASTMLAGDQSPSLASEDLKSAERRLRSATLAEAEKRLTAAKPGTLSRARAAALLQTISSRLRTTTDVGEGGHSELLSFLEALPSRRLGEGGQGEVFGNYPRVLLQALDVVRRGTDLRSQAQSLADRYRKESSKSIRVRFRGPRQPNCTILGGDQIRDSLKAGVVLTDGDDYDVAISLADFSCQETESPRASVRTINSTYVVGQSQVVNPVYVQLKATLEAAQIELARAELTSDNSFIIGFLAGKVGSLQSRLAQTPPFLYQDIEQAYQLQEFLAKRHVYLKATGTYILRLGAQHNGREFSVEADRSTEDTGRAGALPQDRRYSNRDPHLRSFEELRDGAVEDFKRAFRRQTNQAVCDLMALAASDESASDLARMDAMLRLVDNADDTTYTAQRQGLVDAVEAHLLADTGDAERRRLRLPPDFPKPDIQPQVAATQTQDAPGEGVAAMIDRTLDGVVAIETDAGSTGSGFFASKDCQVLTNGHVIAGAKVIIVKDRQRHLYVAEVSGSDANRDLALLRTKTADCRPLVLDRSPSVKIADEVFAIGNPLGLTGTVTKGIISSVRRAADGFELFQIDAALNPGNSGGPLIDRRGRVVGINTFRLKGFEGLNFAVSTAEAFKVFGGALNSQ